MADTNILNDVKESIGQATDDASFDSEILLFINAALDTLHDNDIGNGTLVTKSTKWSEVLNEGSEKIPSVMTYVYLTVKVFFDPPLPATLAIMNEARNELLWRLRSVYSPFKS